MTDKQKRFADEYLTCLNASLAYQKINPKCKNPDSLAAQMMLIPEVKDYISSKAENISERLNLKAIDVIAEIRDVAFSNITDYLSFDKNGVTFKNSKDINCKVVSEVSSTKNTVRSGKNETTEKTNFKLKLYDKMKALDMLGRYFKLFVNDKDAEIPLPQEIIIELPKSFET